MPNILSIVSYKFLPPQMGGQKGIGLFNRFLSTHVQLTCLTTQNNDPALAKEYKIINEMSNSKLRYINPFLFFKARKVIKQYKISHVLLEHPYLGWLGLLLKWFCGIKLVVHSHNIESLRFKSMHKWWWGILWNYERFVHRRAHLNFFIQDNDKQYAIDRFRLKPEICATITYGIEIAAAPAAEERAAAKKTLCEHHGIESGTTIMLFNGTLDYKPNSDALDMILGSINEYLLANAPFAYTIIIAGSRLPQKYELLKAYKDHHILYAGFVDDIALYFKGADIFLNPVTDGGGIKTKVVEALGYDLSVISTISGATGIPQDITGNKMLLAKDGNWEDLARQTITADIHLHTPQPFFEHFYWGNIAAKAAKLIGELQ